MMIGVRQVRFFPDYGADPVWDRASGAMIDLDGLPVGPPTRLAVRAWRQRWEALASQQMRADDVEAAMASEAAEPVTDDEWGEIEREGQQLCAELQRELGSEWSVEWEGNLSQAHGRGSGAGERPAARPRRYTPAVSVGRRRCAASSAIARYRRTAPGLSLRRSWLLVRRRGSHALAAAASAGQQPRAGAITRGGSADDVSGAL